MYATMNGRETKCLYDVIKKILKRLKLFPSFHPKCPHIFFASSHSRCLFFEKSELFKTYGPYDFSTLSSTIHFFFNRTLWII